VRLQEMPNGTKYIYFGTPYQILRSYIDSDAKKKHPAATSVL